MTHKFTSKQHWTGHTQHSELSHGATALLHLADINAVVVGGDIVDGETAQGSLLLHVIFVTLFQPRLLHEPASLRGVERQLARQHGRLLLLYLHVLQLPPERHLGF